MKPVSYSLDVDSATLRCYEFNSSPDLPAAVCLILHGAVEHSLWYSNIASLLTSKRILTFAHDHRGFGMSTGPSGDIKEFSCYVQDALKHIDHIKLIIEKRHGPSASLIPFFLLGHSMGGTAAIDLAMNNPGSISGVVLISPAIIPDPKIGNCCMMGLGNALANFKPSKPLGDLKPEMLFRNKDVIEKWHNDAIINRHGRKIRARQGMEVVKAMKRISKNLDDIMFPFLVVHGQSDKIAMLKGSVSLYETAASDDKDLICVKGGLHQPHHEGDEHAEKLSVKIADWILARSIRFL